MIFRIWRIGAFGSVLRNNTPVVCFFHTKHIYVHHRTRMIGSVDDGSTVCDDDDDDDEADGNSDDDGGWLPGATIEIQSEPEMDYVNENT